MSSYRLYADEPFYKKVPVWVWVVGAVAVVVLLRALLSSGSKGELEDYLR
jgi:hypothetical protein